MKNKDKDENNNIDPKNLMAVERATTALIGTAISLIILGFVVEKFELFLDLISMQLKGKQGLSVPQLQNTDFYNYLGIAIVSAGIILALYTYRYYTLWIKHLQEGKIDTDKNIYFLLSIFVALIGVVMLVGMVIV